MLTNDIAQMLLVMLEVIEEDILANSRVPSKQLYAIYLQSLYKTVNVLVQKSYCLVGPWLSEDEEKQLEFASMR